MKTRLIRLKEVVMLIGLNHSGIYKHISEDRDNNALSGYDVETGL